MVPLAPIAPLAAKNPRDSMVTISTNGYQWHKMVNLSMVPLSEARTESL